MGNKRKGKTGIQSLILFWGRGVEFAMQNDPSTNQNTRSRERVTIPTG